MFFGLIIRKYFVPKEHNTPHIHLEYQGNDSIFDIADGTMIEGN